MSNNMKSKLKGDGLKLYVAVQSTGLKVDDVLEKVDVVKQTLYNHYKEEILSEDVKKMYAASFGVTEEEIFGLNSNFNLPPELQVTEGKKKDVKLLGKHVPLRLKPEEYAEAFGDWPGLPMYNAPVTASFVETYRDESVYKPQYYLHDPRFRDCDFGAIITGDSMHSEIRHGDFIACKEVTDISFLVYGDIYYIVAKNGLETCKYVNVDPKDENRLILVARSEKISPSPLQKDMIHKLYKVRGIVRGY